LTRGDSEEAMVQKAMRMGRANRTARMSHVQKPPFSCQAHHAGMPARRRKRTRLLKLLAPAASAGRGAFLIAGYCDRCTLACHWTNQESAMGVAAYRGCANTKSLSLCWRRISCWRLSKIEGSLRHGGSRSLRRTLQLLCRHSCGVGKRNERVDGCSAIATFG
jgi:hypothetical protein